MFDAKRAENEEKAVLQLFGKTPAEMTESEYTEYVICSQTKVPYNWTKERIAKHNGDVFEKGRARYRKHIENAVKSRKPYNLISAVRYGLVEVSKEEYQNAVWQERKRHLDDGFKLWLVTTPRDNVPSLIQGALMNDVRVLVNRNLIFLAAS